MDGNSRVKILLLLHPGCRIINKIELRMEAKNGPLRYYEHELSLAKTAS
jgi:hypothetical protein